LRATGHRPAQRRQPSTRGPRARQCARSAAREPYDDCAHLDTRMPCTTCLRAMSYAHACNACALYQLASRRRSQMPPPLLSGSGSRAVRLAASLGATPATLQAGRPAARRANRHSETAAAAQTYVSERGGAVRFPRRPRGGGPARRPAACLPCWRRLAPQAFIAPLARPRSRPSPGPRWSYLVSALTSSQATAARQACCESELSGMKRLQISVGSRCMRAWAR
jgi:hypothetical protein